MMDEDDDNPAFEPRRCCACGQFKTTVRNVYMLDVKAPIPGTGWSCLVCHLPADGAIAVVCDDCHELGQEPKWAVKGYALVGDERVPITELSGKHEHDLRFHPEEAERN